MTGGTNVLRQQVDARALKHVWRTLLVGVFVVVVPSRALLPFYVHDRQRILQVLLLAILAASLLRGRVDELRCIAANIGRWGLVAALVVTLGVASALLSADPWTAWLEIGLTLGLIALALAVATDVVRSPAAAVWTFMSLMVVSLTYYAAYQLTFPGVLDHVENLWLRGTAGGFAHPRFMNQYQVVLLPSAAALASTKQVPGWVRGLGLGVASVTWWMILISTGRGAVLALLVGSALAAVFRGVVGRRVAVGVVVSGLLGAVGAWVTYWRRHSLVGELGGVEGALSSSGRFERLWPDALGVGLERPLLGVGPGHLAHVQRLDQGLDYPANHPHNLLLQFVAEWGFVAAFGVALLLAAGVISLTLRRRTPPPLIPREPLEGAVIGLLAGLALSLVSGVFVMPVGGTVAAAAGGIALGASAAGLARTSSLPRQSAVTAVMLLVGLALLAPVLEVVRATPDGRARDVRAYMSGTGLTVIGPRFWQQGLRGGTWEAPDSFGPVPAGGGES